MVSIEIIVRLYHGNLCRTHGEIHPNYSGPSSDPVSSILTIQASKQQHIRAK